MISDHNQLRAATLISRRHLILAGGVAATTMFIKPRAVLAATDGISRSAESIHQEVSFTSDPKRIYEALTEAKRFDRVVQLSGVMQSAALAQMKKPTEIDNNEGGAFSAFGGYITGRQIELVPSELIVQAWRVGSWDRGVYSIAKFALMQHDTGTRLLFDHTGFPVGQADHLATGWKEHYWDPLHKYLSEG
jgi:activator of HSP90 ATPase